MGSDVGSSTRERVRRLDRRLRALLDDRLGLDLGGLPDPAGLPRYVAPLPRTIEDLGLRLAPLVAVVNFAGTAFGFWYYRFQFADTPVLAWPVVPDSPAATLFIGLSLALWRLGRPNELVNALAFFGCIKLGGWTPFVQLFVEGPAVPGAIPTWLFQFLIWSHLAMVIQAFLLHRYAEFPVWAVAVATGWYLLNDVVDYFVPVVGDPHHTRLIAERVGRAGIDHGGAAHDLAAAAAVTLTVAAVFLALATRAEKAARDAA